MALIEISSSDVEIDGVKAVGPNNGAYISNSYGIRAQGSSAASRLNNIYIHNCEITGFGSAAIRPVFLENFRVDNNYLHDTVYAGIAGWSVSNGSMCYNFIKDIEMPEGTTNSYGIALSQRTTTGPDETYPRCSNVRVSYNHIENVPWEGLDTHSGERIIFTNNNVISCGCGIAVVCVDTNPDRGAPHHCIVANNIIDVGDAEVIRPAISLGGADDGTSAYNVVEYARGCVIANNQIKGYPRPDSS